jgi:nucleotide-binding universal stress UspA family protein
MMKLLVYTDGGPTTDKALAFAAHWVRHLKAELAVITVRSETHAMEIPPPLGREVPRSDWDRLPPGLQILTRAAGQLAAAGLLDRPDGIVIRETPHSHFFSCPGPDHHKIVFHECFGSFIEALNREIDHHRYDLLIIAPPERGRMRRLLMGDTTRKLALDLNTSVLVVRGGTPESRLMVCVDGSASCKRAFPLLRHLMPTIDNPVEILWVRSSRVSTENADQAEHCMSRAAQWLEACDKPNRVHQIQNDHPADAISTAAGKDALVVIGASLRHDVYRRTLGTLPMRLLARTSASVLLAKAPPEDDPGTYGGKFTC